ncbi:hypothetical protein ACGFW5_14110 [Streptomyces sp. NPDC048416]|uniref:hypothetical protein n=1 Tax=Streptomyces sp. NPDC048416 TaxID=3365546 RepID=UPI0037214B67
MPPRPAGARSASRSRIAATARPSSDRSNSVERVDADPTGAFFDVLTRRYGLEYKAPVGDAEDRVVLVVRPERTTRQ